MVKTFYIRTLPEKEFKKFSAQLELWIPEKVLTFFMRQRQPIKYQQAVLSYILMRYIMLSEYQISPEEIEMVYGEKGKPYLKNKQLFFNLSHSGEIVTAAFSETEIGVDIEKIREVKMDLAKRFYSVLEYEALMALEEYERVEHFFDLWTLKESYIKYTGLGLHQGLNTFSISKNGGGIQLKDDFHEHQDLNFFQPKYFDGYKYAICTKEKSISSNVKEITLQDFLKNV